MGWFSKKKIIENCPNCSNTRNWNREQNKCLCCGYIHKLAGKDEVASDLIRELFQPCFYKPHDVFVGSVSVPQAPGFYGWYFDDSLLDIFEVVNPDTCLIKTFNEQYSNQSWYLLYIGIAGTKKGRTLQDRIYDEHLRQNSKGSTLRQTLSALLWQEIGLDPKLQLNTLDEKLRLNRWVFDHARVTWLNTENPQKIEKTILQEFGEHLPFNLQDNKKNPYRKSIMHMRKVWRKGG